MVDSMNALRFGVLGGVAGAATLTVLSALPADRVLDLLALGLFGMATIYVGTGLADGRDWSCALHPSSR
jgi:hypothetical protein